MASRSAWRRGGLACMCAVLCLATPALATPAFAEVPRSGVNDLEVTSGGPDGHLARVAGEGPSVAVRLAAPGRPFGTPLAIAPDGFAPAVASGPGGATLVYWVSGGPESKVMAAYRAPGGGFEAPVTLGDDPPAGEQWPVADFDALGDVTLAWSSGTQEDRLVIRTRTPAEGWGTPQTILTPGAFRPQLDVAPSGQATLAWQEDGARLNTDRLVVATRPPGGAFGPKQLLAGTAGDPSEPVVSSNDRGDAVVAWVQLRLRGGDGSLTVHAAFRRSNGSFGPSKRLTAPGAEGAAVSASIAPSGRAVMAWTNNGRRLVQARVRSAAGRLGPVRTLSRDLAINSGVAALAVAGGLVGWFDADPGRQILRTVAFTDAGRPRPAVKRSVNDASSDTPELFAAPDGSVVLTTRGRQVERFKP